PASNARARYVPWANANASKRRSVPGGPARTSDTQQPVEERAVLRQRDPQVLRRDPVASVPLAFEFGTLVREDLGQPLHQARDERIRPLHRLTRFVDKADLDLAPLRAKALGLLGRKEGRVRPSGRRFLVSRGRPLDASRRFAGRQILRVKDTVAFGANVLHRSPPSR